MRALLQRSTGASVQVAGDVVGAIDAGLVVLLGVGPADDEATADALARRIVELRIFRDADGRTNSSLRDVGGAVLLISQFTLFADTRRGRRPGFTGAAPPEQAERLYERVAATLRDLGEPFPALGACAPLGGGCGRQGNRDADQHHAHLARVPDADDLLEYLQCRQHPATDHEAGHRRPRRIVTSSLAHGPRLPP